MFERKVELLIQKDRQTLEAIYAENYGKVEKLVLRNSGNSVQAQDIFQDALIEVWRRVKEGKFIPKSEKELQAYLFQVSKFIWYDELKLKNKMEEFKNSHPGYTDTDWEALQEKETLLKVIYQSLKQFEEPCKSILKKFYFEENTYKQMSECFSYDQPTLKTMKYRCLNKFRSIVKDKISGYEQ